MGCASSSGVDHSNNRIIRSHRTSPSGSSSSRSSRSGRHDYKKPDTTNNNTNNRADLDETGLEDGLVLPSTDTKGDEQKVCGEDRDGIPPPALYERKRYSQTELVQEEEKEPEPVPPAEDDTVPVPVPCDLGGQEPEPQPAPPQDQETEGELEPIPQQLRLELVPVPMPQEQETEPEPEPEEQKEEEPEPAPEEKEAEPEPAPEPEEEKELEPEPPQEQTEVPQEDDLPAPVPPPPVLPPLEEQQPLDSRVDRESSGDYIDVGLGVKERTFDFRSTKDEPEIERRPQGSASDPYTDHSFTLESAIPRDCQKELTWKRPQEFVENPQLFTEGTTRFDIGQGAAGTCWFLSMVANLSERPELLSRVIPEGSYPAFGSPDYDGVFHCKFYRFGEWLDVYIDDYIPIIYGQKPWGAGSSTDPNEMWVSLLEKAFAHMHGSYGAVYGGQPGDAFLALTGGVSERIDFEEDNVDELETFQRIQNALNSQCLVTCVVPDKYDEVMGLVGGHAYSLNGTCSVEDNRGQLIRLMRVRNPWGHTEWKGAWSDGSAEWDTIPPGSVANPNKNDGEFWICLQDFLVYFSQTTICSIMPDFDSDGCSDALDHKTCIFGEWKGETAAGFHKRLKSPKYLINIPDTGMTEDGTVPVVIQCIQKMDDRKDQKISQRVDLYKVWDHRESPEQTFVMEILGKKTNVYMKEKQATSRYRVEPGDYMVVPSCLNEGDEGEYLIRIFTPVALPAISEVSNSAVIHCSDDVEPGFSKRRVFFGEWKSGVNSGGQVSHRDSFHTNPQYHISVPDHGGAQDIQFVVMQEQKDPGFPIGIRIFTLDPGTAMPVDVDYLYEHYEGSPSNSEGGQNKFMISTSVATTYSLSPGDYILLLHMDDPSQERAYSLIVQSKVSLDIREYNTV